MFRLRSWGWITCNEKVLLKCLQSWARVVFISITVRVSISVSNCNNLLFWRNNGEFWYNCHYIIARENVFHPCKIGLASYGVRWSFTMPSGHRLMIPYTDASRCPYDMWPRKRNVLKIGRCPDDYQIRRWCANRWTHTLSVLFVTIA